MWAKGAAADWVPNVQLLLTKKKENSGSTIFQCSKSAMKNGSSSFHSESEGPHSEGISWLVSEVDGAAGFSSSKLISSSFSSLSTWIRIHFAFPHLSVQQNSWFLHSVEMASVLCAWKGREGSRSEKFPP